MTLSHMSEQGPAAESEPQFIVHSKQHGVQQDRTLTLERM